MKNILFILLLTIPFVGSGQGWEQTYGGIDTDYGQSVQQTSDGGYIITGSTFSFGNGDLDRYLIKVDGNGIEQWNQTYGDTNNNFSNSVQQTSDGGYIITGTTFLVNGTIGLLIKTDGNGIEQWSQTFGDTNVSSGFYMGNSVQQTTDGGYIMTGWENGNQGDVFLVKTDLNGIEQWNQTFGGIENDYGESVQQTSDGGYIITGSTFSFGNGDHDVYLIKTDSNGIELWNQTFGGIDDDYGKSVQQTSDGGYIITGYTFLNSPDVTDVYLIKTDGNGIEQWNQTFGGVDYDLGYSVQQTSDGGYIITGSTKSSGNGDEDVYLIKTDGNGIELWNQTFGGTNSDGGNSVQQTSDGGYIITGTTLSFGNGGGDVYLIKTDGNGNVTSTFNIPINPNRKLEKVVDILGREIKHQTNTPFIEIYDDGSTEKKIVVE
jgi:hypothetical protein